MLHLRFRRGTYFVLALCALQVAVCPAGVFAEPPPAGAPAGSPASGNKLPVTPVDAQQPVRNSVATQADHSKSASKSEAVLTDFRVASNKLAGRRSKQEKPEAAETDGLTIVEKGSSSNSSRKAALAALPLDQLNADQKARVEGIVQSVSFFRRLPSVAVAVDPQVYTFFINHPDVAVSIWRAMNISKLQLWQTGKNDYEGDAGDGTVGTVEVLHRGVDKLLVVCEGVYGSPLGNKPIKAKSLLLLQTSFFKESDGTVYVTHRADMFVAFPSQTVEAVSKILSPVTTSLTDRTFCEVTMFLKMMSLAMSRRPDWVEHISEKLDGIPDMRKSQLLVLTANVYSAAQKQALAADPEQKQGKPPVTAAKQGATEKK